MIIADANIIAYLLIRGDHTQLAERAVQQDPDWVAPSIWRHELLNVVATNVRNGKFGLAAGLAILDEAGRTVKLATVEPSFDAVLQLSINCKIGTYDCEYVALAEQLGTRVVTSDKKMIEAFPNLTVSLEEFAGKGGRS